MSARPRCYIASPLGFTEAGREYYTSTYLPALAQVIDPVDPWAAVHAEEIARAADDGTLRSLWLAVGRGNFDLISGCSLLVAYLDGQEIDSGTAIELGYASALGVRCFGIRTDLRQAGEETMAVNLQVEAAVAHSGGAVIDSLEALVGALGATDVPARPGSVSA